ncbi:Putative ubiquitin thioesterase otu1 [Cytospora mali]|uniref:Ubiquitin thioesterase OTU n=1 Tax=Cytospora mali TaxID=578113 RepID=A0A194V6J1_CYTMA|nr:Putative ubiquitin thioesterase otu1 [Valsa mali var. pyri (nom. inval.)]
MADIRFRVRGPGWVETVTATPDWTIQKLLDHLKEKQGAGPSALKYGYPLKNIDLSDTNATIEPLNLKGEAVTFVPKEDRAPTAPEPQGPSATKAEFKPKAVEPDHTVIEWPEKDGYVVLRVMPDDNSCMFTAFGGVLQRADPAPTLRREVAQYILAHPEKFDRVVLEMEPQRYAQIMQSPDRWGGAIELSILSDIYDIEICSVDVKTQRVDRYGEGKSTRCLLLYSGIHYDRIAFTMDIGLPVDFDEVKWDIGNDQVVEMARKLAKQLKDKHYFTDTTDFVLKCDVPGCNWIGAGEVEARKHMKETGHSALSEMEIT